VRNNYRTLQPEEITDPNGNRSQVVFDALGMVAGTAVMGKVPPSPQEGDSLDNFEADLTQQQIDEFSQNPLSTAVSLLGNATTRVIYDLERFINTEGQEGREPVFAATLARETHVSDLAAGEESKVQVSFTYSDGFGREIQQKIQAEAGLAPVRDAQGVLRCNQNLQRTDPRWVGTGRTIFNNKGKPVKQYEPFFSPTHTYEDEDDLVECGVTPIIHYDPLERVIRTDLPNGTFSKVEFDSWYQETWDENDTVLESQWYADRGSPNPNAPEPADQETRAAWLSAKHANTPTVVHLDVLGRTFLTIADNGTDDNGSEQKYETRVELDIEGNQRSVTDALERKVMVYDYDLLGNVIHQHSMEAGERWLLNNVAGNPIRRWDSRNQMFRMSYDELQRPTHSFVQQPGEGEALVERLVYGETHSEAERNLKGQLYQHYDQAGVVTNERFDFKGNLLSSSRTMATEYKQIVDWSALSTLTDLDAIANAALGNLDTSDRGIFTSFSQYDALNRPVMMVTPHNSITLPNVIQPSYNEANLLEEVDVWLRQSTTPTNLLDPTTADLHAVTNIDYNAKGQRTLIEYGNQATTSYEYDSKTFRLTRMLTIRPQPPFNETENQSVQDLRYTYDPVGNITYIYDHSDIQNIIYFRNKRVEPSSSYEYDPLYRLDKATGREHLGQTTDGQLNPPTAPDAFNKFHTGLDHPGNGNAMGTYIKRYIYDAVGNILSMQHRGSNPAHPGWTRTYAYNEASLIESDKLSNRLSSTELTGNNPLVSSYIHDDHGNMIWMPHLENHADPTAPNMHWDYNDQLQQADLGGGGTAYYVYDAAGQRTRKIVEKSPGLIEERIYLGGFEVFRKRNGTGTITLERETLHVMDDQQRIALVETRTQGNDPAPQQLIRYQLGNHLGSASVELDAAGAVISYEEYYPYGSTSYQAVRSQTETSKRYRYTGKERDEESELYYYGARYYVPWLYRWTSSDPMGIDDGVNSYAFVQANPINVIEINGMEGGWWDTTISGIRSAQRWVKEKAFEAGAASLERAESFIKATGIENQDLKKAIRTAAAVEATVVDTVLEVGAGVLMVGPNILEGLDTAGTNIGEGMGRAVTAKTSEDRWLGIAQVSGGVGQGALTAVEVLSMAKGTQIARQKPKPRAGEAQVRANDRLAGEFEQRVAQQQKSVTTDVSEQLHVQPLEPPRQGNIGPLAPARKPNGKPLIRKIDVAQRSRLTGKKKFTEAKSTSTADYPEQQQLADSLIRRYGGIVRSRKSEVLNPLRLTYGEVLGPTPVNLIRNTTFSNLYLAPLLIGNQALLLSKEDLNF
ncbi:MAG: RHS repeat-associated core domain-containing protein, partial [Pleurocapsa sp. MO_192.B19]|nr:RHS repeat-associated core domain-containing protein [Pleurocapsa sp. MO_192.B19]